MSAYPGPAIENSGVKMKVQPFRIKFEPEQVIDIEGAGSAVSVSHSSAGIYLNVLKVDGARDHKLKVFIYKSNEEIKEGAMFVATIDWAFVPYHIFVLRVG